MDYSNIAINLDTKLTKVHNSDKIENWQIRFRERGRNNE